MLDILAITGPIYIAIALGYGLTRGGLFVRADMLVFGQFVIKLALPWQTWDHEGLGAATLLACTVASFFTLSGLAGPVPGICRRGAFSDRWQNTQNPGCAALLGRKDCDHQISPDLSIFLSVWPGQDCGILSIR